jgi:hypothetical protein
MALKIVHIDRSDLYTDDSLEYVPPLSLIKNILKPHKITINPGRDGELLHDSLHRNSLSTPHKIFQSNNKKQLIDQIRKLYIPKTFLDNKNTPWDIFVLHSKETHRNMSNNQIKTIDMILDRLCSMKKQYIISEKSNKLLDAPKEYLLMHMNLYYCDDSVDEIKEYMLFESNINTIIFRTPDLETFKFLKSKSSMNTDYLMDVLDKLVTYVSQTIKMLMTNTILEKLIRRINRDILGIDNINPKSFWITHESIIHQVIVDVKNFFPDRSKSPVFSTDTYKDRLINYIKDITERNQFYSIARCCKIFNNNNIKPNFDEYGITTGLINHPFIFNLIIDNKIQIYKLVITDINYPKNISYKLFLSDRQQIISRDIVNKFDGMIKKEFIKLDISEREIFDKDVALLLRLNKYASYWASLMNIIMNDATRCIRAYVKNEKKTKITLDNYSLTDIKSYLSEIQIPDILSSDPFLTDIRTQFQDSELFNTYHIIKKISKFKNFINVDKFIQLFNLTKQNTYPGLTDQQLYDHLLNHCILIKPEHYHYYMRKMTFVDNQYLIGLTEKIIGNNKYIISNLLIKSNLSIKIYLCYNDSIILIGRGNKILFPLIPNIIAKNMKICIDMETYSDPDMVMNELKKSNSLPYIAISGLWLRTNINIDMNSVMFDSLSHMNESESMNTFLYLEQNTPDQKHKYVYFGQIYDPSDCETKLKNLII